MTAGRIGTIAFVVLLMLLTVGMHAWAGMLIGRVNTTLGDVFSGVGGGAPGGSGGNPRPAEPTRVRTGTGRSASTSCCSASTRGRAARRR